MGCSGCPCLCVSLVACLVGLSGRLVSVVVAVVVFYFLVSFVLFDVIPVFFGWYGFWFENLLICFLKLQLQAS